METIPDVHHMHTDAMIMLAAFIGKDPESNMYGKIIGFFTYKDDVYKFYFHVHKPHQKYPWMSNKMTDLKKLKTVVKHGEEFVLYDDTTLGDMAFWNHTPLDCLKTEDEDAYELRKLMVNVTTYSRMHDFCRCFRKADAKALRINPIYRKN